MNIEDAFTITKGLRPMSVPSETERNSIETLTNEVKRLQEINSDMYEALKELATAHFPIGSPQYATAIKILAKARGES